jgi:hypothetical protein
VNHDQIPGDPAYGNGDPGLTEFGSTVTPNEHNLAQNFVTLYSFNDISEVSYDGWAWSTLTTHSAQESLTNRKAICAAPG